MFPLCVTKCVPLVTPPQLFATLRARLPGGAAPTAATNTATAATNTATAARAGAEAGGNAAQPGVSPSHLTSAAVSTALLAGFPADVLARTYAGQLLQVNTEGLVSEAPTSLQARPLVDADKTI